MKNRRLLVIFIVLLLFTGCAPDNSADIEEMRNEINKLKSEILDQDNLLQEIDNLKLQNIELQSEIFRLYTINNLSASDFDMTVLNAEESEKYEMFKDNYDVTVLKNLHPISIMKLYINAWKEGDNETVYELLTKDENAVMWSKEEHMKYNEDNIIKESDFDIFRDVYDLRCGYSKDSNTESAAIIWKSENGYVDEIQGPFEYFFQLTKDDDIWKVSFMPMQ